MGDQSRRTYLKSNENDAIFRRAEIFHQILMEDFRFMEAARMHSGEYEAATLNTDHLFRNLAILTQFVINWSKIITFTVTSKQNIFYNFAAKEKFQELVITNPYGLINFATYSSKPQADEITTKIYKSDIRSLRFQTRMAKYPPLDIWAHWVLNTSVFKTMMVLVILVNSILIAWDQEMGQGDEFRSTRRMLEGIDFFFLCLFVAEILLKWMDDFHGFWLEGWNVFDFACTTASLIPPILDIVYPGEGAEQEELEGKGIVAATRYLRIIRIFRSLNVVTRLHKIQIIWEAVLKTFNELISITCLMAIFFYIFAIIGIHVFERFTVSHKPGLKYRDAFETIPKAIVHLFLVFTVDQYQNLLDSLVEVMQYPIPVLYIMIWILLAGFIFQNIFTGVMVNNFQNIRESLIEESTEIQQHRRLAMELSLDEEQEDETTEKTDSHLSWENETFQNLNIISTLGDNLTSTIWPRDTLFQYYIILEALTSSIDERNYIMRQLDQALVRHMDP